MRIVNSEQYKKVLVHRVVAATFFGRNDLLIVNHKDGNTRNNRPENLEYVTHRENTIHAYNTGLIKNIRKVQQFDINGCFIKEYPSAAQAARENNCGHTSICHTANGRNDNTCKGFKWQYVD